MKTKYILLTIIAGIILPAYLTSCGEDRWAAYAGQTETDRWIDDTMRVWYYWNEEMPHTDELNYFKTPASFFDDLLSKSDQFSYIDSIKSNSTRSIPYTDYSYGFEYATARISGSKDGVMALMLYVAPDSPADEAGLKRGDWIIEMDGDTLTQTTATQLLGSGAKEIVTGRYDPVSGKVEASATPITLPAARAINDNPVHHQEVLTTTGGRKVGYLVYNHFTPGTGIGTEYDRQLREVFAGFKAAQINDLVLDLRYNNGGLVTCAQLLSSMIAPASQLGTPMAYTEYNKRIGSEPHGMDFLTPELIGEGANLNFVPIVRAHGRLHRFCFRTGHQ